ncbi:MAG TPA: APC family permease, partial [Puia sp.]|nr:APC family permease [Puia sp.]
QKRRFVPDFFFPVLGFLVCFVLWISLPTAAKVVGGIWFFIGLVYLIIKTQGLKKKPVILDFK